MSPTMQMLPGIGFVLLVLPCVLSRDIFITTSGGVCTSPCSNNGDQFYWYWQKGYKGSWNYCSTSDQWDYQGNPCQSPCKSDGSSYTWCKIYKSWSYCGYITEVFETHYTRYEQACVTDCDKRGDYFLCTDSLNRYDYCSPSFDVTMKGEPCRKDHLCGSYGKSYFWCYTDESNNWGYCGKITGDCKNTYHFSHRKKRETEEEVCRVEDHGNRRVTVLIAYQESRFRQPNRNQFMEASHVINMITASTVFTSSAGTMFTYNSVRLDMQGTFMHEGVRYVNLQVQLNGQRQGQSSVCQACFPLDLDVSRYFRYIRRALQTSLRGVYHGDPVRVFIFIEDI
ncbi:uncharacterized protein LOC130362613 [Hyla sarda]|uniref:uncharacterized protein LOC130362613 n=1 Tax=Hyla sarda TaxID=327740 RepID=UPI0024C41909|nr:uncharacterized protein LOC130362613 [Hyla sarda]